MALERFQQTAHVNLLARHFFASEVHDVPTAVEWIPSRPIRLGPGSIGPSYHTSIYDHRSVVSQFEGAAQRQVAILEGKNDSPVPGL
jgi:hypothetical protein